MFLDKFHINSGVLLVARCGSGAKAPLLAARPKLAGWVAVFYGSFLMVYRNNAGRLGFGFISVCIETRWLGHLGGFCVPERPCSLTSSKMVSIIVDKITGPALKVRVSGAAILSVQFLIHTSSESSIRICLSRICMTPDAFLMCAASAFERVLVESF